MNQTIFALGLGAFLLATSFRVHAQKEPTTYRMGILHAARNVNADVFIEDLRQLGYTDGKNMFIDHRFAEGKSDHLPELAKELAEVKVSAMFGIGTPAGFALKQATKTIPMFL